MNLKKIGEAWHFMKCLEIPRHPPKILCGIFWFIALLVGSPVFASPWHVSVDERQGLPIITKGGAPAMSSSYVFWGADWNWANLLPEFKLLGPFDYSAAGQSQLLGLNLKTNTKKGQAQQLVWQFDLDAAAQKSPVIGGGIHFRFDLDTFGAELGEPELLPDNRGWVWGRNKFSKMEIRFDPPLALVQFERGKKSEIRAFFFKDTLPAGKRSITATLAISADMLIRPTLGERFGPANLSTWHTSIVDQNRAPVDLSFMNAAEKPAGKRGFLKAVYDRFEFDDGTAVRFWGTNITARALFQTSQEDVRRQARRLSELGFNLVRLHHHDSAWVNPNIFGGADPVNTSKLDPAMLEKLDWWIKCLKDEGIYVWLDLQVGRRLTPNDGITAYEELGKPKNADLRGFNYINPSIQQAMQRFTEAYVTHRNRHTGLRYAEDPAIVTVLLTNENDITNHFGNRMLPDKNVPAHNALYMAAADRFATQHGLPKDKVWRSWEHGPAKLFLNDLEQRFNADMIRQLRTLGVKVPISTTSTWGDNPLSSLPSLTTGNLIGVHAYGSVDELSKDPAYGPNFAHWFAAARIAGRPLSVTEWNVSPFPVPDRHSMPLYLAATARLQGWNAVIQYAYSQDPFIPPGKPTNWHAYNDPALLATLPAAALLFRQGHMREARTVYAFTPSKAQLFGENISPKNSVALRTAAEKGKLQIVMPETSELPWLKKSEVPANAIRITNPKASMLPGNPPEVVSDTKELRRNWQQGLLTINTPNTQAATGWIGGSVINLPDVAATISTPNASLAVQSLDNHPISQSHAIMISMGARSIPEAGNRMPFYSEPVIGQLSVRAPAGLKVFRNYRQLDKRQEIPASYKDGRYHIQLERQLGTQWLMLSPK